LWENPVRAYKHSETFELVEEYDDERHLGRSLRKRRECGQLYFREWHEWIDWEG
jgi:hypothetical protein